jgi:hypothetical protein
VLARTAAGKERDTEAPAHGVGVVVVVAVVVVAVVVVAAVVVLAT